MIIGGCLLIIQGCLRTIIEEGGRVGSIILIIIGLVLVTEGFIVTMIITNVVEILFKDIQIDIMGVSIQSATVTIGIILYLGNPICAGGKERGRGRTGSSRRTWRTN